MPYITVLFFLATVCMTLPIFCGYFIALLLLLWLLWRGNWRLGLMVSRWARSPSSQADAEFMTRLRPILGPLHRGIGWMIFASLVSALIASYSLDFARVVSKSAHLALKLGLLWYVLATAFVVAVRKGFKPRQILWPFAAWMTILAVYVTVQRATGIDWVHGFDAVLPPNRFAYGVYRISGFMGHPLTLSYNLMLLALFSGALCLRLYRTGKGSDDITPFIGTLRIWAVILGLCLYILFISGSRFPLGIVLGMAVASQWHRLWRLKYQFGLGVVAVVAILAIEGSIFNRLTEIFDTSVPLVDRFQRLIFWKIHWQMFLDHPLAGVSLANYDQARIAYYRAAGGGMPMYTAHNIYLQVLADSGLVGLIGLIAFFYGFHRAAQMALKLGESGSVIMLFGSTLLAGLMQNNLRDSEYLFVLWYLLALGTVGIAKMTRAPMNS